MHEKQQRQGTNYVEIFQPQNAEQKFKKISVKDDYTVEEMG